MAACSPAFIRRSYIEADLEQVISEARLLEDEIRGGRFLRALGEEQFSEEAAVLLGDFAGRGEVRRVGAGEYRGGV